MEPMAHYFYAVKIPDETKTVMKEHMERLKRSLPFSRWVHHQDIHITLAFLGYAEQEQLVAAHKNVEIALRDEKAFPLKINKLGVFGKSDRPRVFWADAEYSPELHQLRKKVFSACEQADFNLETRPYRPHITLARKWQGEEPCHLNLLDIWHQLQPEPLPFLAKEAVLYRTNLQETPKYQVIHSYPLQT
ncbi:RNA 2',3'-cyclic phosphodiesterase [Neobacillus dielmonensis]|uniref:RNA 2',3'-cyclic phosphodiesterase n=1 Tax=Neobacillus dielmonensis TaxID=1347369 RepID=UPI0005A9089B|nr:RNA 2',3'-cyclic phosphodiesterase [Neobacillus dielmonensis]